MTQKLHKSKDFLCEKFVFYMIGNIFRNSKYTTPGIISDDDKIAKTLNHIVFSPLSDNKQDKIFEQFLNNKFYNNLNPLSDNLLQANIFAHCLNNVERYSEQKVRKYYYYLENTFSKTKYDEIILSSTTAFIYSSLIEILKKRDLLYRMYFEKKSSPNEQISLSLSEKKEILEQVFEDKAIHICIKMGFLDKINNIKQFNEKYPSGFCINNNLIQSIVPEYIDIVLSLWERQQLTKIKNSVTTQKIYKL